SICRAVRRPRAVALSPYSPKLTLLPTVATPLLRPFCSLRYLRLAGCSILRSWSCRRSRACRRLAPRTRGRGDGRRHLCRLGVVRHDLALKHPHLDADDAVGRVRLGESVFDVRAQCVQRNPSLAVPLAARDLDAVQPPRAHHFYTLRAEAHRVLHRTLHRAPEHDPLLELLRDRVGD